eukprot:TRINITY_DN2052_c0_g1_i2.p1 TRINITY_DN2052_c0_g1~~TRINITY_DN2052_c0_g1_i2.p1  ORF type:complete len:236 (-),score=102.25 TRINITY_DN2052_c0_g1_i2:90-797(-)
MSKKTPKKAIELQTYEVERVIDCRQRGVTNQYLIKWLGYDAPEDNTWEDASNLSCDLLIKEFEERNQMGLPHTLEGEKQRKRKLLSTPDKQSSSNGKPSLKRDKEIVEEDEEEEENLMEKSPIKSNSPVQKDKPASSKKEKKLSAPPSPKKQKKEVKADKIGFEAGDEPHEILGGRFIDGELNLWVAWKKKEASFVPAWEMKQKATKMLLNFYESKIKFDSVDSEENDAVLTNGN